MRREYTLLWPVGFAVKRYALALFVLLFVAAVACATGQTLPTQPSCAQGQTVCEDVCVDTQNDSENCGTCGNECPLGQACAAGACSSTCPQNDTLCGGDAGKAICVDTQSDNTNCGGCGKTCPSGTACAHGSCSSACANGETQCGESGVFCANLKSDNQNCGACGAACSSGQVCANGTCASTCATDQTMCGADGGGAAYCANLQTDNANCGACGAPCTGTLMSCNAGTCASLCTASQTLCAPDGGAPFCADTSSDNTNCGTCGHACTSPNPVCSGGTCIGQRIAVVICGAPGTATWNNDVQTNLQNTNAFSKVDVINCNTTTPSVSTLQGYQAALVFSDTSFNDATTLGNNLATYVSDGGYVVVAVFANASVALGGNWISQGYNLITASGQEEPTITTNPIILNTSSPLVAGVSTLTATAAFRSTGAVANGGVVVAEWGDGKPLIVAGTKNGAKRAELNLYPPSSAARSDFWTGDGATIMKNALLYR